MKSTGRFAFRIRSTQAEISSGEAPLRCVFERRRGRRQFDVVFFLEHVERHVDVHRPRPARQHGGHRLAQRQRQHVDARRLPAALDHRADDVGEVGLEVLVDFLERAAVELRVGTLAVIASIAEESLMAQASGITMLQEPGPQEVSVATGSCRTRK